MFTTKTTPIMANQIANLAFYRLAAAVSTANNPVTIVHGILGSKMNWRTMAKKLTNELQRNVCTNDCMDGIVYII